MVISYLLTFILLLILIIIKLKDYIRTCILAFCMKGPPALPLLGNTQVFKSKDILGLFKNFAQMDETKVFRIWLSVVPFIFLTEPRHIQTILGSSKNSKKNIFYSFLRNFLGEGLLTNNGEEWRNHRRKIQPYFQINMLSQFIDVFCKGANKLVDELKHENDVNIANPVNNCVMNILQEAVLGVPMTEFDPNSPFRRGEVSIMERCSKPWLLLESFFKFTAAGSIEDQQKQSLYEYTKEIVAKRKKELINGSSPKISIMDFFIEIAKENNNFTDDDIINEVCTFMLAGQDSVGSALAFSLYNLAKYQDIQQKVMEEQKSIFTDNSETITLEDIKKMVYLEQCINETLRLQPSVPAFSRILTEDVDIEEMTLPKGTNICMSPFNTHRLANIFPNPEDFDPERFSADKYKKLHPFAFIPFSAGPRNCLGYKFAYIELKSILSIFLRKYHVSLVPGKENLQIYYRVTLRARGGIWVNIKPRN